MVGAAASLMGAWVQNRENLKRLRLELASQDRHHERELQARFMDYLMKPRVEAHVAVLTQLWVLRSAAATYLASQAAADQTNYILAKKLFDGAYVLNSAWVRPKALAELDKLSKDVEQLVSSRRPISEVQQRFVSPIELVEWSLGIEQLEQYMRDLTVAPDKASTGV